MAEVLVEQWRYACQGGHHTVVRDDSRIIADFVDTAEHARLIASAPELLAALEGMAAAYNRQCGAQLWSGGVDRMAQARAAIAKARGG